MRIGRMVNVLSDSNRREVVSNSEEKRKVKTQRNMKTL